MSTCLVAILVACSGALEPGEPADAAARILGRWRSSSEICRRHVPEASFPADVPEHVMSLVRDDSVTSLVPPAALEALEVLVAGRMLGAPKPHLFFFGRLDGQDYLLFLSQGLSGPYSDSDGGFATIGYDQRDQTSVLVVRIDAADSPAIAYERVSDA